MTSDFPRRHEIIADPLTQVASFADVNHLVKSVTHQINAGFMWDVVKFGAEIGFLMGNRHQEGDEVA